MKPGKTWATLDEMTLQRASAAWVWMRTYVGGRPLGRFPTTSIGDAMMSKLVPPCVILRHNGDGGLTIASLGNRVWGVLGLALVEVVIEGTLHFAFARTSVDWFHIIRPDDWEVVPFVAIRHDGHDERSVVMKALGSPLPLVKHVLTTKNTHTC